MRRLLALLTVPVLVLAACGDDDDSTEASESGGEPPEFCGDDTFADDSQPPEDTEAPEVELPDPAEDDPGLDAVTVTGEVGEEPTVEISAPVEIDSGTVRRVLIEGEGEPVDGGMLVLHMAPFNGRTGELVQDTTTFDTLPSPMVAEQQMLPPPLLSGILGVPDGSRVLVAFPVEEMFPDTDVEQDPPIPGLEAGDSLMWVIDLMPTRALGEEVEPEEGMPTVTRDDDGVPSIEIPDADAPTEVVSQALIEGDGPEVTEGQEVLAQYTGVCWEDGEEFDSSWTGTAAQPATPQRFALDAVIEGWTEGIPGHTVGSQILLVVPSEKGYGSEGTANIPPGSTLVFVIDILAAADPLTETPPPGEAPPGDEPPAEEAPPEGEEDSAG